MSIDSKELLKEQIRILPEKPGIYKYYSAEEELIYVGKAKNIKKRVSSYFTKVKGLDVKTQRLVNQIRNIEFTIVDSEFDAYLLENNLIKENKPKYNILLKDDKTYPYLYISRERFPRLISTRKLDKKLGKFYGPYTSVKAMNTLMDLVRKIFGIRTCNYNLSQSNIDNGKFKVCLEYHIGNCKGPCEGLINEKEYLTNIDNIQHILKGNLGLVRNYFKEQMSNYAGNLEFEKAHSFKQKLDLLEDFQASSIIVNPKISDLDVITIADVNNIAIVNYFCITNGLITKTKTIEVKNRLDESKEEILISSLFNLRSDLESTNKEVITNLEISKIFGNHFEISNPKIGDKRKLIELSYKNALFEIKKILSMTEEKVSIQDKILISLKKDLRLPEIPRRVECFDNSNIQGTNPVAAMVCFINAKPAKKEYRHFNIKTVIGPDDFASMHEIITRRYKRVLEENLELPNLIIIDGGKGQLSAACEALKSLGLYGKIPIIGIAKRLEEIYYPEDSYPLFLDKKSMSLKFIQTIRDETHRFAITFHRTKRSNAALKSQLLEIPGIGEALLKKLILDFKSISGIKNASFDDLKNSIGTKKAELVIQHFKNTSI